jgi:hypothetical protein
VSVHQLILPQVPAPAEIYRRLGELDRERSLLQRLLRLALAAHEERERRAADRQEAEPTGAR